MYVIGDIHGQIDKATTVLREAELIDGDGRWAGGDGRWRAVCHCLPLLPVACRRGC